MTSFETVYNAHKEQIFYFILTKVGNKEVANELTNDTFIKYSQNDFDENQSALLTWLHNLAKNSVIDYFRKEKKRRNDVSINSLVDTDGKEYFEFVSPETTKADSLVNRNEFINKFNIALDGLNPLHKKVSILYFINEMKYNEISEICDIPLNSVKNAIGRSRKVLQSTLISLEVTY